MCKPWEVSDRQLDIILLLRMQFCSYKAILRYSHDRLRSSPI